MNEVFKQYKDTNYYISNYGRVINAKYNHELSGKISAAGYREVVLYYNKKNHYKRVHRLVAEYFCEKKDGNYVGTYESQDSAAKSLNINRKTIYNAMHSSMKNAKGYTFEIVKGGDADAKIE